jgi:hypothetical protein
MILSTESEACSISSDWSKSRQLAFSLPHTSSLPCVWQCMKSKMSQRQAMMIVEAMKNLNFCLALSGWSQLHRAVCELIPHFVVIKLAKTCEPIQIGAIQYQSEARSPTIRPPQLCQKELIHSCDTFKARRLHNPQFAFLSSTAHQETAKKAGYALPGHRTKCG